MLSYCRPCTSAIVRCYSRNSASVGSNLSVVVSTRAVFGGVLTGASPSAPQTARDEGRETLGLIGSAACETFARSKRDGAALSISPFERSRWRLRRTRELWEKLRVFALCLAGGRMVWAWLR